MVIVPPHICCMYLALTPSCSLGCLLHCSNCVLVSLAVLPIFQQSATKELNELRSGHYSLVAATLAHLPVQLFGMFCMAVSATLPLYIILDFTWEGAGLAFVSLFFLLFVFEAWAEFCAVLCSHLAIAATMWLAALYTLLIALFFKAEDAPWPLSWIAATSPWLYSLDSSLYTFLSQPQDYDGAELCEADGDFCADGFFCPNITALCFGRTGPQVFRSTIAYGFFPDRSYSSQHPRNFGIMIAWIVFFKLLSVILRHRQRTSQLPSQAQEVVRAPSIVVVLPSLAPAASIRVTVPVSPHEAGTTTITTFDFRNCSCSVSAKCKPTAAKDILTDVSGSVVTGQMMAIIGPSGAGKTTLLRMLQLEQGPGVSSGSITLNGAPFSDDLYRQHCASVSQAGSFWPMLTSREQLLYTVELVRPTLSATERGAAVDELLESMGLLEHQNTKAGGGLSGGQLRRLSLCAALAKRPSLLFLDEPTSGLDSAAAAGVMTVVADLAKVAHTAVICVIHQPSAVIFNKFDQVLLLSCGRTAYLGPAGGVADYFATLGTPLPEGVGICESALDVINKDFAVDKADVSRILDAWAQRARLPVVERLAIAHAPPTAGFLRQLVTTWQRCATTVLRDPTMHVMRLAVHALTIALAGGFAMSLKQQEQGQVQPRLIQTYCAVVFVPGLLGAISIPFYSMEQSLIRQEIKEGRVGSLAYVLSSTAVTTPVIALTAIVNASIYCALFFVPWSTFGEVLGLFIAFLCVVDALAQVCSLFGRSPLAVGIAMLTFVTIIFEWITFTGNFQEISETPWPFRLFCYISPARQLLVSVVYSYFTHCDNYTPCDNQIPCIGRTGEEILHSLTYQGYVNENQLSWRFAILIGYWALFKALVVVFLALSSRAQFPKAPAVRNAPLLEMAISSAA